MREKYESLALVQLKELAKGTWPEGTSTMKGRSGRSYACRR